MYFHKKLNYITITFQIITSYSRTLSQLLHCFSLLISLSSRLFISFPWITCMTSKWLINEPNWNRVFSVKGNSLPLISSIIDRAIYFKEVWRYPLFWQVPWCIFIHAFFLSIEHSILWSICGHWSKSFLPYKNVVLV